MAMTESYNGMPANELGDVHWVKSRWSGSGECVQAARLRTGEIAIRNSRFPDGPALLYTPAELAAFLEGVKAGEFDHLLN